MNDSSAIKTMVICACCGKMIGSAEYKTDGDNIYHADCQAVANDSGGRCGKISDNRVEQLVDDLAGGKQSMCAPFANMHNPMSSADKRLLEKALLKVKQPK